MPLGEGSYGVVIRFWNVSTGENHVVKTPKKKAIETGQVKRDAWKREAHIMGQVSHDHIVKLINSLMDPEPELHLEYMPCGSLENHMGITYSETFTIVRQCLSALAYLHEQETPIAHRDIKPANILVESRSEDGIFVKLGDFGLARTGVELLTLCGTPIYLAPEVHSSAQRHARTGNRFPHTVAVDIWSLGVVAFGQLYNLPQYRRRYLQDGVAWCEKIIEELQKNVQTQPSGMGSVLLERMVVLPPESRQCARDCFNALEHLLSTEGGSVHDLTPSSYSEQEGQATLRYALQNREAGDLSAVVRQPTSQGATTPSYPVASRAPPPESLSSLSRLIQPYLEFEEPSPSAIRRYSNWQEGHQQESFLKDCSPQLGENNPGVSNSQNWADQFLQLSQSSHAAAAESIPQADRERDLPSQAPIVQGGNVMGAEEYEEMLRIALLSDNVEQSSMASHQGAEV